MELGVAIGLGVWFMTIGTIATLRLIKDYKEK